MVLNYFVIIGSTEHPQRKRIMVVVGEASGDVHGARLVNALLERDQTLELFGVGGANLRQTKFDALVDVAQIAGMGLVELVGNLRNLWVAYRMLQRALEERKPNLIILIDFPEFNLRLARLAKRLRIPVLYYISPQVWAWRQGRIRQIARRVDHMAVVFPFEAAFYEKFGVKVSFVGHPLLDIVQARASRESTLKNIGLEPEKRTVALLPGSRHREVTYHLPVMLRAAQKLNQECDLQFVLVQASTVDRRALEEAVRKVPFKVPIVSDNRYDTLRASDLVWTASGTATLETALMLKPMVIVYRVSWLTYFLARLLVRVKHIGMVNIIAGDAVVPELIQSDLKAERVIEESRPLLDNRELREKVIGRLAELRKKLGLPGAADRVADIAMSMMA
ncbi:MAG TPA: lipid-A-disaccharide synthase [Candidatus Binatia bacterium]|nr:lipid-A-disaccharide synthase [Candidatus Binatia bacterium]